MIARLTGILAHKSAETLLLDVSGVGYELSCPLSTLESLPIEGATCSLVVHTYVREDQLNLYGFSNLAERKLFRMLIGVSGIGPKLGLALLSGMNADSLRGAIKRGDIRQLCKTPGIGKRGAERLILELRDRLPDEEAPALSQSKAQLEDLESALRNLGYRPKDIERLLTALQQEAVERSFEELLREALKRLRT